MSPSGLCVRRPVGTLLLALGMLLAGCVAFVALPIAPLPQVEYPTVQVSAGLPGASPETMAAAVAAPLERRFGRIAGLAEMTSTSSLGQTAITLQFDLARDVTAAARDVQAAINAAGGELPANLPSRPSYRKVNPADAPILIYALTSTTLPLKEVFDVANTVLAQKIAQVDGVGQVVVGGGQQPAVRVQADPGLLAGAGLGFDDVAAALPAASAHPPTGSLAGARESLVLAPKDQLEGAAGYREIVLGSHDGATVRLGDVARAVDGVENARVAAWHNGHRAVLLIVKREPSANILATIARVRALVPDLVAAVAPAVDVDVAVDRATTIRAAVSELEKALLLTVALVVAVVWLFLRSPTASAIPCVAVPLSLAGTFAAMAALGYSLDNLSLMALTIATGFVVDDAIVVTENVMRHIENGASPRQAALDGAGELSFTIVAITASLLAVFVPILAMGGIVGRLFREFAVVLVVAIGVSAAVSLTVTPSLCALWLRPEGVGGQATHAGHARRRRRPLARLGAPVGRALAAALDATASAYARVLDLAMSWPRPIVAAVGLTAALTAALFVRAPKGLFPQADSGLLVGFAEGPQDVSFEAMRAHQEAVGRRVAADPAVRHVVSFLGGGSGNAGSFFVDLVPLAEGRPGAEAVISRLRRALAVDPSIRLYLQTAQDLRIGGRSSRSQYQYTLQDADLGELAAWAPRLQARLAALPELRDVNTDRQAAGLSLGLTLDRDVAAAVGLGPVDVDAALSSAFGQRQVALTYHATTQTRVVLETLPALQRGPSDLDVVALSGRAGAPVPLGALARAALTPTALAVSHQGQLPATTLSFNVAPGVALGPATAAVRAAVAAARPPPGLRGEFAGNARALDASIAEAPWLISGALLAIYVVLGMLYESLIHPLTIIASLPSACLGGLLALRLANLEFTVIALVGMLLLLGIVKKNAIMMIDVATDLRRRENLDAAAAIRAACALRFRPITMTTLAAIFGALPLALGEGPGAELRRPLGVTICGGLVLSQVLTLVTTPVLYIALDRLGGWLGSVRLRRRDTKVQHRAG